MKDYYGIMLIGCGHIGMEHLMSIYYRDNIRIEAVIDSNPERAKAAARRCHAKRYGTDYRDFLDCEAIDIVIIATYAATHLSILNDCLAHHKHVLCEKPIAATMEQGYAFVQAVTQAKEKVLVAHILRHNQSYKKIKELIDNNAIGELRLMRMIQNHHSIDWPRYCQLMNDCSPTVDCGVHYYDLAQWIAGSPIIEVTGFGVKTQPDAPRENHTLVTFRTNNGCAGFYEVGWGQSLRSSNVKEFIGTKGRISLEMRDGRLQDCEEGDLITLYHSDTRTYETINCQSQYKDMYAQLSTLIGMIENNLPGTPTIDEVWQSFLVAKAAEQAIELGTTVKIAPSPIPEMVHC